MSRWATATEIPRLIRQLGSRRTARVDSARARLAIIGERAVDALTEALEGETRQIRARVMPLLALIRDARSREPLTAMLLDRDPGLREIAVRSLARFPSPATVSALERLLNKERVRAVRVAAVYALLEQYSGGQERAVRKVVDILFDTEELPRLRNAALALLPMLAGRERKRMLRQLQEDSTPEVAAQALEYLRADERDIDPAAAMPELTRRLSARDYSEWNEAVHRLASIGAPVVGPLVAEMRAHADDPELCTRIGMVLKALSPREARGLADLMDETEEPLPLRMLVEAVGVLGEKALIYRLKELIERISTRAPNAETAPRFDPMQSVRAKAHLELAKIGSRVAVADLRDALANPQARLESDVLSALELIGKKDEIPDLLRAYAREDQPYMRDRIGRAVRTIMRRERLRRNNRLFRCLSPRLRDALERVLPPLRRRPVRRPRTSPSL